MAGSPPSSHKRTRRMEDRYSWSPNQLAYNFAFELGNFGAASAVALLMLVIGLGAAYLMIRWTGFFNIEN